MSALSTISTPAIQGRRSAANSTQNTKTAAVKQSAAEALPALRPTATDAWRHGPASSGQPTPR
ncbi:hypothetical protein DM793_19960 [Paenarthrobacter nitroguajacolicus]|uniref:hypothetical protein n=1 Tax=Paenarthrobacter nitroguajacolicus TaxID=211146 RepID=UPI0015C0EAC5|nr:hypothetical protein [Paenarthrobacter nitroguajacolicus]NWL13543.1 hypothetical protein [Paenarthrobacter nitroguajacolicus]